MSTEKSASCKAISVERDQLAPGDARSGWVLEPPFRCMAIWAMMKTELTWVQERPLEFRLSNVAMNSYRNIAEATEKVLDLHGQSKFNFDAGIWNPI